MKQCTKTETYFAIHLWFKENLIVDVLFENGIIKRFDLETMIDKYPFFSKLKDRKLFLKGKLDVFGITWTNEIDIDGDTIYFEGQDVTNEYLDYEQYLVGFKLKQARLEREISQDELTRLTGIDQATISKIENGRMNLSIKTIMKIVRALDAKISFSIK